MTANNVHRSASSCWSFDWPKLFAARLILVLIIGIWSLPNHCCGFVPNQLQSPSILEEKIVHGTVTDIDGAPAKNCIVRLVFSGRDVDPITKTDEKGHFELTLQLNSPFTPITLIHVSSVDGERQALYSLSAIERSNAETEALSIKLTTAISTNIVVQKNGKPVADAIVVGVRGMRQVYQAITDANGNAILSAPDSHPAEAIWAFHEIDGICCWYPPEEPSAVQHFVQIPPKELRLDLYATRKGTVKVVDEDGNTIPGEKIYPAVQMVGGSTRKIFPAISRCDVPTNPVQP